MFRICEELLKNLENIDIGYVFLVIFGGTVCQNTTNTSGALYGSGNKYI